MRFIVVQVWFILECHRGHFPIFLHCAIGRKWGHPEILAQLEVIGVCWIWSTRVCFDHIILIPTQNHALVFFMDSLFFKCRIHWSMSEFGALGLVSVISPSSDLIIMYHFFSWTPYYSRNILSKFQKFYHPDPPVGIRFNRFIESACMEHWFWWFWSPIPTWLGPISSRSVLGCLLGPLWALVWIPCSPPWIHMDPWWGSKLEAEDN